MGRAAGVSILRVPVELILSILQKLGVWSDALNLNLAHRSSLGDFVHVISCPIFEYLDSGDQSVFRSN